MKKHYINYADNNFKKQQKLALKMAKKKGCFDDIQGYHRGDIDDNFYQKNKVILDQPRGGGYWLWKPYLINKKLSQISDGDYLFYSDSGAFFVRPVDILINELEKYKQDIMCFELSFIESQWTKKELFLTMNCDDDYYKQSNQVMGGFILIKKTPFSVKFCNEFLKIACNEVNITDRTITKQDNDFIEHRHDQSILSLLYKKYKIRPFKDATQFAEHPIDSGTLGKLQISKNGVKIRHVHYPENYNHKAVLLLFRKKNFMIWRPLYKLRSYKFLYRLYKFIFENARIYKDRFLDKFFK